MKNKISSGIFAAYCYVVMRFYSLFARFVVVNFLNLLLNKLNHGGVHKLRSGRGKRKCSFNWKLFHPLDHLVVQCSLSVAAGRQRYDGWFAEKVPLMHFALCCGYSNKLNIKFYESTKPSWIQSKTLAHNIGEDEMKGGFPSSLSNRADNKYFYAKSLNLRNRKCLIKNQI